MSWQKNLSLVLNEFWHFTGILFLVIIAVSLFTGFLREFVDQNKLHKKLGLNKKSGVFVGAFLGMLTPFCSASAVPVTMTMIQMGISFSTIFAFQISAPLINFVVLGLIFAAYGWKVTLFYFLWIFSCAVILGSIIGRTKIKNDVKKIDSNLLKNLNTEENFDSIEDYLDYVIQINTAYIDGKDYSSKSAGTEKKSTDRSQKIKGNLKIRFTKMFIYSFSIFLNIFPYIIVGAAISAISLVFIPAQYVETFIGSQSSLAIPFAGVIGIPLYLRIEVAIPFLNIMLAKGMGTGAAMALLIGATGDSLPELSILSSSLKPRAIMVFSIAMILIAVLGGYVFQFLKISLV